MVPGPNASEHYLTTASDAIQYVPNRRISVNRIYELSWCIVHVSINKYVDSDPDVPFNGWLAVKFELRVRFGQSVMRCFVVLHLHRQILDQIS